MVLTEAKIIKSQSFFLKSEFSCTYLPDLSGKIKYQHFQNSIYENDFVILPNENITAESIK